MANINWAEVPRPYGIDPDGWGVGGWGDEPWGSPMTLDGDIDFITWTEVTNV